MGFYKYEIVAISTWGFSKEEIEDFITKNVPEEYKDLITPVSEGWNDLKSFAILPDGSKEGWSTSDKMDEIRKIFIEHFKYNSDLIHISFGGDQDRTIIEYTEDSTE